MKKLWIIGGTRPEIIKLAPLYWTAMEDKTWECKFCFSGQHREMGLQIMEDLRIAADINLDLMTVAQKPEDFLSHCITGLAREFREHHPDWVAVQGDTTTALAGALAGFYTKTPVVHVEAGLRTNNLESPFPEEGHRQLISRVAKIHCTPTQGATESLKKENILEGLATCGNTGIDCLLRVIAGMESGQLKPNLKLPSALKSQIDNRNDGDLAWPIVLVTMHRRESIGDAMREACNAIRKLADRFTGAIFILPLHPNPQVRSVVEDILRDVKNCHLIEPQPYTGFACLLKKATVILTDSGGIQEEAPALGKPVIVMRDVTERPEAVECGAAVITGCDSKKIYEEVEMLLTSPLVYKQRAVPRFPFGDGTASKKIMDILQHH